MAELPVAALDPGQLIAVLRLVGCADGVQLKLSVPDSDRRSALAALDLDPFDAEIRQVAFFDTPDLDASEHGVMVRVRHMRGKTADSAIALRPLDPARLPDELRTLPGFGVEVDALPRGFVCSATITAKVDPARVKETLAGRRPLSKLFSKEQRALFEARAPDNVSLDSLERLGPICVLKLRSTPRAFGRRLAAELWSYPDGSRILELSTKCPAAETLQVAIETTAFLSDRGIDVSAAQQTKTRTAMHFFASTMQARGHATRWWSCTDDLLGSCALSALEAQLIAMFSPPLRPEEVQRCVFDAVASDAAARALSDLPGLIERSATDRLRSAIARLDHGVATMGRRSEPTRVSVVESGSA